jgi:L-ascorbate metabolism protein UlaG (beta-lactamase superfamily)
VGKAKCQGFRFAAALCITGFDMNFRWLGVAGIEMVLGEDILVIDPYLTRAPFRNLFVGYLAPDTEQIRKHLPDCDHLLITHAHFDHVMDAA